MKKIMILVVMVAAIVLPTMAQIGKDEKPNVQFQSTSTMQTSGSTLASQPMLNEDGTAYSPSASAPAAGPKKVAALPPTPTKSDGDSGNVPIGDAVLPLALMALAFAGVIYLRRRRAALKR